MEGGTTGRARMGCYPCERVGESGMRTWVAPVHDGKAGRAKSRDDIGNDDVRAVTRYGKETGRSWKVIE